MKDIIFELIYDTIDFKTMMLLRTLNMHIKKIYDQSKFWYIVNMTDVNIRNNNDLLECFDSDYFCSYNLSGKNRSLLKIPRSLMVKLCYIRLLVF